MKKIAWFLPLILLGWIMVVAAGGKKEAGFEGVITYSMSYEELPEELQSSASMLPKEMTMYLKPGMSRIEQNGLGKIVFLMKKKQNEFYMLMDMMGEKTAYKGTMDDLKDTTAERVPVVKETEETKVIAGYTCKKAIVTYPNEDPSDVWYTDSIPGGMTRDMSFIKGFPMEYTKKQRGMSILMTVTSLKKEKLSGKLFELPSGYTVKPYSDFKKMQGG